jgi:hypothetical protein
MPLFYFHVHDDQNVVDEEGRDLPDLDAARHCAVEGARDLICADVRQGRLNLGHSIIVTDSAGLVVARIPFGEAFTITG